MKDVLAPYAHGCLKGIHIACTCCQGYLALGRMFYLKPMYLCYMCRRDYTHDLVQPIAYGYCGECEYRVDKDIIDKTHNLSGTTCLELAENRCRNWNRNRPELKFRQPMRWSGSAMLGKLLDRGLIQ